MSQRFVCPDREQSFLMPPSLRDWLAQDHLAWLVLDVVDALDLGAFYADYRADGHGRPAHDPAMMVALALYAYATGTRSSREIERRCMVDAAFRVLAGNLTPEREPIAKGPGSARREPFGVARSTVYRKLDCARRRPPDRRRARWNTSCR